MMQKEMYKVLGVMSGTSLDGIDIAEIELTVSANNQWNYRLGTTETVPYSEDWVATLKEAVHFSQVRLKTLDEKYTIHLAETISKFIETHTIEKLDAICSHGHTILHQPEKGVTLQIGNLPELSERVQETVVCDFRVQDVALGGQGAPLVPIGDRLLFSEYDYCLNLGGFANCSFERNEKRIAYDICPVNIVLNYLAGKLGQPYDDKGKIAKSGTIDNTLSAKLNTLEFYKETPPKSLGLEWVQANVFPLIEKVNISTEDTIATFTEHIAIQLAAQFKESSSVFISGGGAYNSFLLERLSFHKNIDLVVPNSKLIEYKEALVFGLLGVLKLRDEVNCLASVTGAEHNHSSGKIFYT